MKRNEVANCIIKGLLVFWGVTLCFGVSRPRRFEGMWCLHLPGVEELTEMRVLRFPATSGSTGTETQLNIPGDQNP